MSKKFKITFGILIGLFYVFILLCLINVIVVKSNKYYMYDFENITVEESMEFVEYFDIEIPERLQDSPNLGEMTQLFITQSVVNPDFYLAISWDVTHIYGKNISECVNKCLGNEVDLN